MDLAVIAAAAALVDWPFCCCCCCRRLGLLKGEEGDDAAHGLPGEEDGVPPLCPLAPPPPPPLAAEALLPLPPLPVPLPPEALATTLTLRIIFPHAESLSLSSWGEARRSSSSKEGTEPRAREEAWSREEEWPAEEPLAPPPPRSRRLVELPAAPGGRPSGVVRR